MGFNEIPNSIISIVIRRTFSQLKKMKDKTLGNQDAYTANMVLIQAILSWLLTSHQFLQKSGILVANFNGILCIHFTFFQITEITTI